MDQAQTSDDAPLLTHSAPQSEQTTLPAQQKPLVTIVHASVGSGHKAAANAIAQAFDLIRGTKGIPEDIEIEVLDILDLNVLNSTAIRPRLLLREPRAPFTT